MPGYHASGIRPTRSEWQDENAGILRAEAVLALALPTPFQTATAQLATLGFKIGLLIRGNQRILSLVASAEPSLEDLGVSQDLAAVFGTPAGSIWVGRVVEKRPVPNYPVVGVAEYRLLRVLTGVSDLPQVRP